MLPEKNLQLEGYKDLKLHPSLYPNKNLDAQPLDVDVQTVEVELSGQAKRYLGIWPKTSPVVGSKVYPPSLSVMLHWWQVKQLRWKNLPSALMRSST